MGSSWNAALSSLPCRWRERDSVTVHLSGLAAASPPTVVKCGRSAPVRPKTRDLNWIVDFCLHTVGDTRAHSDQKILFSHMWWFM